MIPARIILVIGTIPEEYTIAFGGVDTGSMNPKEAPKQAPNAGGKGLTPDDLEIAIIMGMTMLADAVLDVVSLIIIPRPIAMAVIPH